MNKTERLQWEIAKAVWAKNADAFAVASGELTNHWKTYFDDGADAAEAIAYAVKFALRYTEAAKDNFLDWLYA